MSAKGERAAARPRGARLRRVAAFDGKVAAWASATTAADLHHPVAAAAGRYRRGNGLAPAEHHVRAVPRRLHPHAPRTLLGLASDRDILATGARRPAMPHEARMIEAVAASHIAFHAGLKSILLGDPSQNPFSTASTQSGHPQPPRLSSAPCSTIT